MGNNVDGTKAQGDMEPGHPPKTDGDYAKDTTLLAHAIKTASTSLKGLQ